MPVAQLPRIALQHPNSLKSTSEKDDDDADDDRVE